MSTASATNPPLARPAQVFLFPFLFSPAFLFFFLSHPSCLPPSRPPTSPHQHHHPPSIPLYRIWIQPGAHACTFLARFSSEHETTGRLSATREPRAASRLRVPALESGSRGGLCPPPPPSKRPHPLPASTPPTQHSNPPPPPPLPPPAQPRSRLGCEHVGYIYLSIYRSIYLSIYLSLSIYHYLSIYLSIYRLQREAFLAADVAG